MRLIDAGGQLGFPLYIAQSLKDLKQFSPQLIATHSHEVAEYIEELKDKDTPNYKGVDCPSYRVRFGVDIPNVSHRVEEDRKIPLNQQLITIFDNADPYSRLIVRLPGLMERIYRMLQGLGSYNPRLWSQTDWFLKDVRLWVELCHIQGCQYLTDEPDLYTLLQITNLDRPRPARWRPVGLGRLATALSPGCS